MSGKGKQNSKRFTVKSSSSNRDSGYSNSNSSSGDGKLAQQQQQIHSQLIASSSLGLSEESSESSEVTGGFPIIKTEENEKSLPRYASILLRTTDEKITMEDLDPLQMELEVLLTSVVMRYRMLNDEIKNLSDSEEKSNRRSKSGKSLAQSDKKSKEDKLKPKEIVSKSQSPLPVKLIKQRAATSSATQVIPNPHEIVRVEGSKLDTKLLLPKNDSLNKFWASIEPYCGDITPEDIKLLEKLISTHTDLGEYKKIPPLGRHYSAVWAEEELMQEEEAGRDSSKEKKPKSDVPRLLAQAEKKANGISGPLTQRLVSALMEENLYVGNNNADNKMFRDGDPPVLRDLSIQNSMNLEMRMHKELIEQGLLDPDSQKKNPEDDEILTEIKRCQRELIALASHNEQQLKRLLLLAREESARQALKRKISVIDNEIIDHYEKLVGAKQRKSPLSKKEQDKAWAALKERETLLEQLNMLPSNDLGEIVPAPITVMET